MSRKASLVMRAVLQMHDHVFHALAVNEEGADVAERVLLQGVWARLHVSLISHPSGPAETDRARNLATEMEANRGDDIRDFLGLRPVVGGHLWTSPLSSQCIAPIIATMLSILNKFQLLAA